MPIEFFCEHCQSKLRTPDETAGKRVRCPQCGNISSIPMTSSTSMPSSISTTETNEPLKSPESRGNISHGNPYGANPFSSPAIDQSPPSYSTGYHSTVNRETIRSRLLGPGIALIVANSIALLGGLAMLLVGILNLADGRVPAEEAIGPFGAAFYVIIMSSVSLAGGIAMVSFKNRRLAFAASITSILNGLCCCIYPIAFGIWALVVLLDHDVQNHYK